MGVITSLIIIHCSNYIDFKGCVDTKISCVNRQVTTYIKQIVTSEEDNANVNENDAYAKAYLYCVKPISNNCSN